MVEKTFVRQPLLPTTNSRFGGYSRRIDGVVVCSGIDIFFRDGQAVLGSLQDEVRCLDDAVVTGLEAQVVVGTIAPIGIGAVHAMVAPFVVNMVADFPCCFGIDVFPEHNALDSPVRVGRDEDVERIRPFAQDVVGQAADDDAGFPSRQALDDLGFIAEHFLLLRFIARCIVDVIIIDLGQQGPEETLAVFTPSSEGLRMFFAGQIEDFRIVIRDTELTGDELANIAAAAAVFTGNRNDQGAFCIFLDPSRMVFAAFDFADSMVAEEQVFNRPCHGAAQKDQRQADDGIDRNRFRQDDGRQDQGDNRLNEEGKGRIGRTCQFDGLHETQIAEARDD